jgi:hypothetical protein
MEVILLPLLGLSFWCPALLFLSRQFMVVSAVFGIFIILLAAGGSLRHFGKFVDATATRK